MKGTYHFTEVERVRAIERSSQSSVTLGWEARCRLCRWFSSTYLRRDDAIDAGTAHEIAGNDELRASETGGVA